MAVARLGELQAVQRRISTEAMAREVGREVEVLAEGALEGEPGRRFGRTSENRVVHFEGSEAEAPAGARLWVRITRGHAASLTGVRVGPVAFEARPREAP